MPMRTMSILLGAVKKISLYFYQFFTVSYAPQEVLLVDVVHDIRML